MKKQETTLIFILNFFLKFEEKEGKTLIFIFFLKFEKQGDTLILIFYLFEIREKTREDPYFHFF